MDEIVPLTGDYIGLIVSMAARAMGVGITRAFAQAGRAITCEQWIILRTLWDKDGRCQQELALHTGKDKASITRLTDALEKRGLVRRKGSESDRRQKLIFLTDEGVRIKDELVPLVAAVLLKAQAGIDRQRLEQCRDVLYQFYSNLC